MEENYFFPWCSRCSSKPLLQNRTFRYFEKRLYIQGYLTVFSVLILNKGVYFIQNCSLLLYMQSLPHPLSDAVIPQFLQLGEKKIITILFLQEHFFLSEWNLLLKFVLLKLEFFYSLVQASHRWFPFFCFGQFSF